MWYGDVKRDIAGAVSQQRKNEGKSLTETQKAEVKKGRRAALRRGRT